jgi:hypothetical protein
MGGCYWRPSCRDSGPAGRRGNEHIEDRPRQTACQLGAAMPKRWRRWDDIADLFAGRSDPDWERDRDLLDQSVTNLGAPG